MVTTLLHGLTYKESSRTCIVALTACSMEMPKTMYKMIEKVELVSKELNHFGVIAGLFRQIVVDLCYFALFEDISL